MQNSMTIFISHVSKDAPIAAAVKAYLERIFINASVFASGQDLRGGDGWFETLRQVLERATAVIGIISQESRRSTWVHFELGAGFPAKRSIPLVTEGITFDTLKPPLKHVQGRTLDEDGLKALARDVSALAEIREPDKFPGIRACLKAVNECLDARQDLAVEDDEDDEDDDEDDDDSNIEPTPRPVPDQALQTRRDDMVARFRRALIADIRTREATFDVPSTEELEAMSIHELCELAKVLGADIDFRLRFADSVPSIPAADAKPWVRMDAENHIKELEAETMRYESEVRVRSEQRKP